nr:uncharacterized protein LOC129280440 [Lytechinus pictus]
MRATQRIADRICTIPEEKQTFLAIANAIPEANDESDVELLFETLCGKTPITEIPDTVLCLSEKQRSMNTEGWEKAKAWVNWWQRKRHARMICRSIKEMPDELWDNSPNTTNAVEALNKISKPESKSVVATLNHLYRCDRSEVYMSIAAERGIRTGVTQETRRKRAAQKRRWRQKCIAIGASAENSEHAVTGVSEATSQDSTTPETSTEVCDRNESTPKSSSRSRANKRKKYTSSTRLAKSKWKKRSADLDHAMIGRGVMVETVKEEKTIVYCSFTGECDDLCLALCDCGVEAAAYTGHNRTAAEKEQIHKNMNDGVIQVLVATQAFGLGVNIPWIRWVIHIGCPPNIPVWVQAAGRAGRDGMPANAVIYFAEHHDLQRVKFWTKNVAVGEKIKKKAQFKDVLLYLYTAMAGKCLQERQLAVFGEKHQSDDTRGTCCDGCEIKRNVCSVDARKEIVKIQEALTELKTLGLSCVSETKLCEWLNGKERPWMGKYSPTDNRPDATSFGGLTKKPDVLGIILRQAAALDLVSLVILESRKDGRVDLINKYWSVTEENQQKLEEVAELILPTSEDINTWYEHKRKGNKNEGKTQKKSSRT